MITQQSLVFIPGVGFRQARSAMLVSPVSAERGEWSVTIERLVLGPDHAELGYSLTGPADGPLDPMRASQPSWARPPLKLRATGRDYELTKDAWHGGSSGSGGAGTTRRTVRVTPKFEPLPQDTRSVEVIFGGELGDWVVPLLLTVSSEYGIPAKSIEVADDHHGVTIAATGIARGDSMTAVDLRTSFAPAAHPRFMRSIGVDSRGFEHTPQSILTDDRGSEVRDFAIFDDEVEHGRDFHQIFVFPALSPEATRATLRIDHVVVAEHNGEAGQPQWTKLAVPSESDITFGSFEIHATVTRENSRRGPVVRVALDDGAADEDRRLLYPETVWVDGKHGGISFDGARPRGDPSPVTAQAEQTSSEVWLESPVVRYHGPWVLGIEL